MGQVSAAAIRAFTLPDPQNNAPTANASARAQTHALVSAVRVINQAGAVGPDREVTYSTDSATKALVISVVDKQSKQVIVQWPSEYALQMAQQFQKEHPEK
jgi:uncharacterized FlaG/YvyC family protein